MVKIINFDKDVSVIYKLIQNSNMVGKVLSEKEIQDESGPRIDAPKALLELLQEGYIRKVFLDFKMLYFIALPELIDLIIKNIREQYSSSPQVKNVLEELKSIQNEVSDVIYTSQEERETFLRKVKNLLNSTTPSFIKYPNENKLISRNTPTMKGNQYLIFEDYLSNENTTDYIKINTSANTYYLERKVILDNIMLLEDNIKKTIPTLSPYSKKELQEIFEQIHSLHQNLNLKFMINTPLNDGVVSSVSTADNMMGDQSSKTILASLKITQEEYNNLHEKERNFFEILSNISSEHFFKKQSQVFFDVIMNSESSNSNIKIIMLNLIFYFNVITNVKHKESLLELLFELKSIYFVNDSLIDKLLSELNTNKQEEKKTSLPPLSQEIDEIIEELVDDIAKVGVDDIVEEHKEERNNKGIDELPTKDIFEDMNEEPSEALPIPNQQEIGVDIIPMENNSQPR